MTHMPLHRRDLQRTCSQKQKVSLTIALVSLFLFLAPSMGSAGQANAVDKTIQHLVAYVAQSELVFIRNFGEYTSKEASEHMQRKYEYFGNKIDTPEDFIERCATRSVLSGRPYMVVDKHGEKIKTGDWLASELERYRQ